MILDHDLVFWSYNLHYFNLVVSFALCNTCWHLLIPEAQLPYLITMVFEADIIFWAVVALADLVHYCRYSSISCLMMTD